MKAGPVIIAMALLSPVLAGAARADPSIGAPPPRTYANACGPCHDRGGYGARVLADRADPGGALIGEQTRLSAAAIRTIVRRGLGAMPAISRLEVSDPELDAIVQYLLRSRSAGVTR